jgi:hypothetical protein
LVYRVRRRKRIAPRDPQQRFPSAGDDTVARDHDFGVSAARRCESALNAYAGGERRQRALVAVNAGKRERLRVYERH